MENTVREELSSFNIPDYREIPEVGLYLDQVVKYINGFFEAFPDMKITPSMLTNYVKTKLVKKVSKKTYCRDQIARFIFIALSKTVISLDNIKMILATFDEDDFSETYDYFRRQLKEQLSFPDKEKMMKDQEMMDHIVSAITHKMRLEKYLSVIK